MDYYTSVTKSGNSILVRGYKGGKQQFIKAAYSPNLYIRTIDTSSKYRTIFGEPLEQKHFDTMKDASAWVEKNGATHGAPEVYGNDKFLYQYLGDTFAGKSLEANYDHIKIVTWDIETEVELDKFPNPIDADERIQLVSIENHKTQQMITWGLYPWNPGMKCSKEDYICCNDDEPLLITRVVMWFNEEKPDVLTGWNSSSFDNPYFINRGFKIVGNLIKKISPWGIVRLQEKEFNGKQELSVTIEGILCLDYLDLYKKFSPDKQESYKLDFVGEVELGQKKVEYDGTFKEFYRSDFPKFVHYNRVDVKIVSGLESKLMLIRLAIMLAHDALCRVEDALGTVQIWDCIIYNYLLNDNVIVPLKNHNPYRNIVGAYVKPPLKGNFEWFVTFDATSLYPSIMMAGNVSPETLIDGMKLNGSVDDFIHKKVQIDTKYSVLANGHMFRNDIRGFIPVLVEKVFDDRVIYKNMMKDAKKTAERLTKELKAFDEGQSSHTAKESLVEAIKKAESDVSLYNLRQLAKKTNANSLYGAFANQWFRFYDDRLAEGITMTGQLIIRSVMNSANVYLNDILKTNSDYVLMSDTDSNGLNLGPLVKKFFPDKTEKELVDIVDTICKKRIAPVYEESCNSITKYLNLREGKIVFKRESIASTCFFSDMKKRYALAVWDNEGVRYSEPKIKIVGFECVRSDVPRFFRDIIQETIHKLLLEKDEESIQKYLESKYVDFKNLAPEDIGEPTGVNNLAKYSSNTSIFTKGTPIHVKASLIHNHHIKQKGLVIPEVAEGNKIKFVKLVTPNPLRQEVVAFQGKLPVEFNVHKYVDYESVWKKGLMEPVTRIMDIYGWTPEESNSLDFI